MIVAQETLVLRWVGFSPTLWLLIPAFSLDSAPPRLTPQLQCPINAPLPLYVNIEPAASVQYLAPLYFPRKITIDQ